MQTAKAEPIHDGRGWTVQRNVVRLKQQPYSEDRDNEEEEREGVDRNSDDEDARHDVNNKAGRHKVEAMDGGERLNKHWREPEAMGEGMGKLRREDTNSGPGVELRWDVGGVRSSSLTMADFANLQLVVRRVGDLTLDLLAWALARWGCHTLALVAQGSGELYTIDESVNKSGERCDEVVLVVAREVLDSGHAHLSAVGPRDECNAADKVLVVELAHTAAWCWKGCGRFLESCDKDLMCGVGECKCWWHDLMDTAEGTQLRMTGLAAATLARTLLEQGQEEHLALGVLAGHRWLEEGWAAGGILFWAGGGALTWVAGGAVVAPKSQNLKQWHGTRYSTKLNTLVQGKVEETLLAMLALVGSGEETWALGFGAVDMLGILIFKGLRYCKRGWERKREGGHLFDASVAMAVHQLQFQFLRGSHQQMAVLVPLW
ncbi:hypothetical protein B0H14DRAFT_2633134 [Mycena olivaceomarginata]|nr:hypothetical protein B0H14DRAFT_2633134 [Mycena olivaceomarginata]